MRKEFDDMSDIDEISSIDIDDVVKKGKRRVRKIIVIIVAILVGIMVAAVIFLLVKKNKEEKRRLETYNAAIEAEQNEQWEEAVNLFDTIRDYKDVNEHYSNVKFAYDLLSSEVYKKVIIEYGERLKADFNKNDVDVSFDYKNDDRSIVITQIYGFWDEYELTASSLEEWKNVVDAHDEFCKVTYMGFKDYYDINIIGEIYFANDSELKYSSKNGVQEYSFIDFETERTRFQEELYKTIVDYVDEGEYFHAISFWANYLSGSSIYDASYKDLDNYVIYSEAMNKYGSATKLSQLGEVYDLLKSIEGDFKSKQLIIDKISDFYSRISGYYYNKKTSAKVHISAYSGTCIVGYDFQGDKDWYNFTNIRYEGNIDFTIHGDKIGSAICVSTSLIYSYGEKYECYTDLNSVNKIKYLLYAYEIVINDKGIEIIRHDDHYSDESYPIMGQLDRVK